MFPIPKWPPRTPLFVTRPRRRTAILEYVGCNLPKTRGFDALAPYRREIPSWPYFYHAPDATLATELKAPEAWDPSTYDGDASFE